MDKKYINARYQRNSKQKLNIGYSTLVHSLKSFDWLPDINNVFYKPSSITIDKLSKEFIYNDLNGLLSALNFGENIRKSEQTYKEASEIIKKQSGFELSLFEELQKNGITEDDLRKLMKLKQIQNSETIKLQDSLLKNQSCGDTPLFVQAKNNETIIVKEDEYERVIKEKNENIEASFKVSTTTNYKVQDKTNLEEIEQFIYKEYEGHCQICGDTFAYESRNIFKIKSLNIGKSKDVNRKGNTLSLCHKHHDIFQKNLQKNIFAEILPKIIDIKVINKYFNFYEFVNNNDINEEKDAFYRLDEKDEFIRDVYFLPIKLFGRNEYIKFTEAHIKEFVIVWNEN